MQKNLYGEEVKEAERGVQTEKGVQNLPEQSNVSRPGDNVYMVIGFRGVNSSRFELGETYVRRGPRCDYALQMCHMAEPFHEYSVILKYLCRYSDLPAPGSFERTQLLEKIEHIKKELKIK